LEVTLLESAEIQKFMVKDHTKILKLLKNVEENIESEFSTLMNCVEKFSWNLEKHIFTEEKALFTAYKPGNVSEGYSMLPEVIKEHNTLLNRLHNMQNDLRKNKKIVDFYGFKELLINHKKFEEENLYPLFDQELNEIGAVPL